jgi:outer membrane protein, heavy metal efflux system
MRLSPWLRCVFLAPVLLAAASVRAEVDALSLDDVLDSVMVHHPLVQAAQAGVDEASAEVRAARGEFDPVLTTQGRVAPAGYYSPRRLEVTIEQPTPFLGASLYTGYRMTRGKVPSYYGEYRTLDGGELRGGVRLPILQGRSLDARRAGIARANAQARSNESGFARSVLEMQRDAAQAYFAWVAAGRKLLVQHELLSLAEVRDAQIKQKVELGALPELEQLDNRRTILERTRQIVAARRALEKSSIDLSLYLRSEAGEPRVPSDQELPSSIPLPARSVVGESSAIEQALKQRPELDQAEANIEAAQVEQALARNNVQPRLDVFGEVSRDFGNASPDLYPTLAPTVVEAGVTLSVPLLQRRARGKRDAADAKLAAAEQRSAFARDRVRADVQDALSQLRAAEERVEVAQQGAAASRQVADGERERFELGATTVLFVNIREQAAADAQNHLIDALQDVGLARVRLTTAMGRQLSRDDAQQPAAP